MPKKPFPVPVRSLYNCSKCPAYCCTYDEIAATKRDIERLAKHFDVSYEVARERFTKPSANGRSRFLRVRKDRIFKIACQFLDQETRNCTIYHARPAICRAFPVQKRCGYYEFLKFERSVQSDPGHIAKT